MNKFFNPAQKKLAIQADVAIVRDNVDDEW